MNMRHLERHKKFRNLLFLTLVTIGNASCVSVKLGNENVSKSATVRFDKPAKPFEVIALKNADESWQNKNTGTTISYLSICNDTSDPTLQSLRDSTVRGIEEADIEKENMIPYNNRQALRSDISGHLDGVKVMVKLLIFKKNFCNYTISMVGIQSKYESDSVEFEKFIKGFIAP